jgi:subtilisin family serine protease
VTQLPGEPGPIAVESIARPIQKQFANVALGAALAEEQVPVKPFETTTIDWLLTGRSGRGVNICLIDSGVEYGHADIHNSGTSYTVSVDSEGRSVVVETDELDVVGHGTACAGVISKTAPDARVDSVRVLGPKNRGQGDAFLTALAWAIGRGYDIVNLSLSTRRVEHRPRLMDLAEAAATSGVLLVCSAHNSPVESYPWTLASVISVGSHSGSNPYEVQMNPDPPVEFYAGGVGVSVAWLGGVTKTMSGNSFATPAITATLARVIETYPHLRAWQYKHLLSLLATNVRRHSDD